ncbi:glycosyltransferase [Parapedobacter koreensis]|uniref:Glycosyltransferase involved in cell wall bisynthesis n=1 Tax=Parapedobacter koreensis TaxID=332977 RepID=A0A1H7U4T0_9SPHI|nr:glycosyltransferase [Parapedobacter koreensis]SEL91267.1 Glycosyltransferase involved in cell wall bisynthesis [Parapedobacter koreensis]
MDIIFNPPVNEENQYIQLVVGELRAKGYRIHPLDTFFSSVRHFRSIKLVHLNWFENVDDSSFFVALRSFVRKLTVLVIIKLSGKPLVWTMHNRTSHEKGLAFFSRTLTRLLVRWSWRVVIHSHQSTELLLAAHGAKASRKAVYIPHPNFIGVYGAVQPATHQGDEALHLLFTGMVKPYKNLELLIDVVSTFGPEVQLTIAGKAIDGQYQQQVARQAAKAGNVQFLPYFVPDSELATLLASADAMALPYDLSSSLNSGTIILAFSYQRTVICPDIGTVADLGTYRQYVFHYEYVTEDEHRTALKEQVARAVAMKRQDPTALERMGAQLQDYMAEAYNPHQVGVELDGIYHELLGRQA